ncbi:MAG: FkbM family methyltransferase, partial [Verrucomicrobiaceae bacterium]
MKKFFRHIVNSLGYEIHRFGTGNRDCWPDIAARLSNIREPIILDVGANIGQTASEILELLPNAQLHCFEPAESSFEALQVNLKKASPEASAYRLAFGAKAGSMLLRINEASATNSLLDSAPEESGEVAAAMITKGQELV